MLMFIEVHLHFSQLTIFFRLEWKRILFLQAVVFADSFMPADDELKPIEFIFCGVKISSNF